MNNKKLKLLSEHYKLLFSSLVKIEGKMEDIISTFHREYINQVIEDNKGKIALCPVCDSPLNIIQTDFAECTNCEVAILVKQHCERVNEYIIYNHVITQIKNAIVIYDIINKKYHKYISVPPVFSIQRYNDNIRPEVFKVFRNYNIIDLEVI